MGFVEGSHFIYKPSYARDLYNQKAIAQARSHFDRHLGRSCRRIPIVLDGGKLVHHGTTAVLTEKVLRNNPRLSALEREESDHFARLQTSGVHPGSADDEDGHADGIVRFLSENVLLVNDDDAPEFAIYRMRRQRCLRSAELGV